MVLLEADEEYYADLTVGDLSQMSKDYTAFYNEFAANITLSEGFYGVSDAKTVKSRDGEVTVKDGPSQAEVQMGGFYLIEARDMDEAIAIVRRNPAIAYGSAEIRQCTGPIVGARDDRYEAGDA